jgi:hypothetical protein
VALAAAGMLAAACGGAAGPGVASLGKPPSSTSGSSGSNGSSGSSGSRSGSAVASSFTKYVRCMRSHGIANMPYPKVSHVGGNVQVNLSLGPGTGVNPRSPQFTAANNSCKRFLPKPSGVPSTRTITPADRTDYLKGAACMRSHGFHNFPDPVFQGNNVTFNVPKTIDSHSSRFESAVATCEKLIPPGLPYSSPGDS